MYVPIYISNNTYHESTVRDWQRIWSILCGMTYHGEEPVETIITQPQSTLYIDGEYYLNGTESHHSFVYGKDECHNGHEITFDYIWKQYSEEYKADPKPVPQLRHMHVPRVLFDCLGTKSFMKHAFPNCKITYWKE